MQGYRDIHAWLWFGLYAVFFFAKKQRATVSSLNWAECPLEGSWMLLSRRGFFSQKRRRGFALNTVTIYLWVVKPGVCKFRWNRMVSIMCLRVFNQFNNVMLLTFNVFFYPCFAFIHIGVSQLSLVKVNPEISMIILLLPVSLNNTYAYVGYVPERLLPRQ